MPVSKTERGNQRERERESIRREREGMGVEGVGEEEEREGETEEKGGRDHRSEKAKILIIPVTRFVDSN